MEKNEAGWWWCMFHACYHGAVLDGRFDDGVRPKSPWQELGHAFGFGFQIFKMQNAFNHFIP